MGVRYDDIGEKTWSISIFLNHKTNIKLNDSYIKQQEKFTILFASFTGHFIKFETIVISIFKSRIWYRLNIIITQVYKKKLSVMGVQQMFFNGIFYRFYRI